MKTVQRFQPGLVCAYSSEKIKQIPKGKMWLTLCTVEVVELDMDQSTDLGTSFCILAGLPGEVQKTDKVHANLLRHACREISKHVEANKDAFAQQ